jgi:hypothetical protein
MRSLDDGLESGLASSVRSVLEIPSVTAIKSEWSYRNISAYA